MLTPRLEFNEIQTSKRSTYRKKVAAMKKATGPGEGSSTLADASMMSMASHDEGDASTLRDAASADGGAGGSGQPRVSKKPRIDPSRDSSRMDIDDHDPSDAESAPDDAEDDEDEDDEVEEEEEEEDEEDAADEENGADEDDERAARDEDEALDDEDSE